MVIWPTLIPACVPKTEAMPKIAAKTPPSAKVPTQPSGEIVKSWLSDMRLVVA